MNWSEQIELELRRGDEAEEEGNQGKARTCARRAVGIAVSELKRQGLFPTYEDDFMRQVKRLAVDESLNVDLRTAAERLSKRISEDFTAASTRPMEDARIILRDLASLSRR